MALWMEAGSDPVTDKEQQDLDAINALKDSAARELREKGNEYVKMGRGHYAEATDCYTRAINQKIEDNQENSILFSNRAHVNLLLGNYRCALSDAQEAIKYNPGNIKAYYRGAKAAFSLDILDEARRFCILGLEQCSSNAELKNLEKEVITKQSTIAKRKREELQILSKMQDLVSAFESRKLKFGLAAYKELTGFRQPWLDNDGFLHWPVLLLYGEVMSSDFIEDFCENDIFASHLDMMFSEDSPPLAWDMNGAYTREAIELYYLSNTGPALSKRRVLNYLLEDTSGGVVKSIIDNKDGEDMDEDLNFSGGQSTKWVKVNLKNKLLETLQKDDYVIPGIPVFYVVSRQSSFYADFISKKWLPP